MGRDALFDDNCRLKDANIVLQGDYEKLLAEGRACRGVAEEEHKKRVIVEDWSRELEVAYTLAESKMWAQREYIKELKADATIQFENAKAAATEEIARLKEHYTRQLQDMYAGAIEQTLFILERDYGLDIKGLTVDQFSRGVKHPGYLQHLRDAPIVDEEDYDSEGEDTLEASAGMDSSLPGPSGQDPAVLPAPDPPTSATADRSPFGDKDFYDLPSL